MLRSFLVAMMISPLPLIPCDEFVEGSWRATEKSWFYSEKWFTLWWSNIAMENGLYSSMIYDELPTKNVWRLWFSTGTLNQELVILNGEIMQILRWTGDWVGVIWDSTNDQQRI